MENKLMLNYYQQLNVIYDGDPWIDESFQKKLIDLSEEEAFRQPMPGVHSVAEVLSHVIEWRRELIDRMRSGRPPIPIFEQENNWYSNEWLGKKGWNHLVEEFEESQDQLMDLWKSLPDSFLSQKYNDEYPYQYLVEGIVHHDLYHLGQIGLIIKMVRNS